MSTYLSLNNYESDDNGSSSSRKKIIKNNRINNEEVEKKPFDPLTAGLGPVQASLGTDFPEPDIKNFPHK